MTASAYPLAWPEGWRRTPEWERRQYSGFRTTFDKARIQLVEELQRLGGTDFVISSYLAVRNDGMPYSGQARQKIVDPGVALYFTLRGRQMVMARDEYQTVHDNLRSIGLAVNHLRGLERHGGASMMERAFEGFAALPPPASQQSRPWREVLNVPDIGETDKGTLLTIVESLYRKRVKEQGEGHPYLVELNLAVESARKELSA